MHDGLSSWKSKYWSTCFLGIFLTCLSVYIIFLELIFWLIAFDFVVACNVHNKRKKRFTSNYRYHYHALGLNSYDFRIIYLCYMHAYHINPQNWAVPLCSVRFCHPKCTQFSPHILFFQFFPHVECLVFTLEVRIVFS